MLSNKLKRLLSSNYCISLNSLSGSFPTSILYSCSLVRLCQATTTTTSLLILDENNHNNNNNKSLKKFNLLARLELLSNNNYCKNTYFKSETTDSFTNLNFLLNNNRLRNLAPKTVRQRIIKKYSKQLLTTQSYENNPFIKMTQPTINYFAHSFIDRCSDKRKDTQWINEQMKLEKSVFILFHVDKPFVSVDDSKKMFTLSKFTYEQVKQFVDTEDLVKKCVCVFLGVEYDKAGNNELTPADCHSPYSNPELYNKNEFRAWFAIDTSAFDENVENVSKLFIENGKFFEGNFLRLMAIQDLKESSIIAQARSVFCWIDRNKFCATCGSQSVIEDAGSKLSCKNKDCKSNNKSLNKHVPSNIHYPRVDPVVIMLIVNPSLTHFLLGRKKQFPTNMYSCLAGFVEAGKYNNLYYWF